MPHALPFLVLALAGWVIRHQEDRIDYRREENRVLREHRGPRPFRLTDAQRCCRLAVRDTRPDNWLIIDRIHGPHPPTTQRPAPATTLPREHRGRSVRKLRRAGVAQGDPGRQTR